MKYLLYGAIAFAVLVVLAIGALFYLGVQSKNGTAPGLVDGRLADCPSSPNCVSSETGTPEDKKVAPLPVGGWARLPAIIAKMGGEVAVQQDTYLAVQFTSSLFKFVDDVEFRLTDTDIQVRSASRVGHSDAGVNKTRVDALREQLGG